MLIVISSPSGGGKTTIIRELFNKLNNLSFSVSATTRRKREYETDGKDYYFLSRERFNELISNDELAEWEEVHGEYYGTLKSEIQNKHVYGKDLIFDIDVKGAVSIKNLYDDVMTIYIDTDIENIKKRLEARGTETSEQINKRLRRVEEELKYKNMFDHIIRNDDGEAGLSNAVNEIIKIIKYKRTTNNGN